MYQEKKERNSSPILLYKKGVVCHLGHIFKISAAAGHEFFIPLKIRVLGFKHFLLSRIHTRAIISKDLLLGTRVFHKGWKLSPENEVKMF